MRRRLSPSSPRSVSPPRISPAMLSWFTWYARRYVTKSFHAVQISGEIPTPAERPLIIYLNHASWWDPLICLVLAMRFFPERRHFAPIDAAMLQKYRFFQKLGFFGVEPATTRGARQFLRTGAAICQLPDAALWITAEGQFNDVRRRPVSLRPGLARLLERGCNKPIVVPLAIEYTFFEERFPEVLCRFGETVKTPASTPILEEAMTITQNALAGDVIDRDPDRFSTVLGGSVGVGGIYDAWRRMKAWAGGARFDAAHGKRTHA